MVCCNRKLFNAVVLHTLILAHLFTAAIVLQDLRYLKERQWKFVSPKLESLGTGNLLRRKQLVPPGIANTGIQRPALLADFFYHPLDEGIAVVIIDFARLSGVLVMLCVSFLTALLCHVLWGTTGIAFSFRCSTPKFIENGRVGAAHCSSDAAKENPLTMRNLNHAPFFQRKMAA